MKNFNKPLIMSHLYKILSKCSFWKNKTYRKTTAIYNKSYLARDWVLHPWKPSETSFRPSNNKSIIIIIIKMLRNFSSLNYKITMLHSYREPQIWPRSSYSTALSGSWNRGKRSRNSNNHLSHLSIRQKWTRLPQFNHLHDNSIYDILIT